MWVVSEGREGWGGWEGWRVGVGEQQCEQVRRLFSVAKLAKARRLCETNRRSIPLYVCHLK